MDDFLEIVALPYFSILNPEALAGREYGMMGGAVVGSREYEVDSWTADQISLNLSESYWGVQ